MTIQRFTTTFSVDQTLKQVFAAITAVRGWWSGDIEGGTAKFGDEFTYRYQDIHYSRQRFVEVVPSKKVLDSYLSFPEDKTGRNGTKLIFEIARTTNARAHSLKSLITTGKGDPNKRKS